jgi:chromosome segregation ATPase
LNAAAPSSTSKRDSSTQTGQLNEHITTNAVATTDSDSCIWDQAELGILRQEFRSVKAENVGMKGRIAVLEKELSKYTHGNRQLQKTINLLKAQLNEAHTANRRLHMLSQHLKQELDRATANVEQLRSTENDRNRLAITVQQLEAKLLNDEQTSKQKQAALEMKWTALLEQQRLGDVVKISDLTTELNRLVSSIHDLETKLTTEQTEHSRTRKGLEHLQKHFSSLPQSGEKLNTSDRGQRDQLMKLMY